MHTTAVLVRVSEDRHTVTVERTEHRDDVGSFHFDMEVYTHLANQIAQKHGAPVRPFEAFAFGCAVWVMLLWVMKIVVI